MTIFALYSRPDSGPEAIAAVPERFVWTAFVLTPFWAIAKHARGFFALWLVVVVALFLGHEIIGTELGITLYGLFALWSGCAAPAIAARALERSGHMSHGDLAAPDRETAETLWLQRTYGAGR